MPRADNPSPVALSGYLTNRQAIADQLGESASDYLQQDDAALIYALFCQQGMRGLEMLEGPFACLLWDQKNTSLIAIRDHFGRKPLFWHENRNGACLATSPRLLAALAGIPYRLSHRHLARIATDSGWKTDQKTTLFEGIHGVPAATILRLSQSGNSQHKFWQPDPDVRQNRRREDDLWDEFRHHMFTAVAGHLPDDGPAIALLSGGLDSSAIVSVAASVLAKRNRNLVTISAIPSTSAQGQADERDFMTTFDQPNLTQVFTDAPDTGPLDNMDALVNLTESPLITSRHFLYQAFADKAHEMGGTTLLDGAMGELGPTNHGNGVMPEWLLAGRWRTLARETMARSRVTGISPWSVAKSNVIRPFVKRPYGQGRHLFAELLTRSYLRENAIPEIGPLRPLYQQSLNQRHLETGGLIRAQRPSRQSITDGALGVEFRYPFLDKGLLEFCLAAPAEMKHRNGYNRYLVRRGLDGLMPPANQWRISKAPLSVDYATRYNRQRSLAEEMLASIAHDDPVRDIVDVDKLCALASINMRDNRGSGVNRYGLHLVPAGLFLIAFLRMFDTVRP